MQEIQHILFGQLLFPLTFLPYSTCCQELCTAVFYSFCKVLRKSKHPCCRLRLTRLVLTVSAVSFLLHPTVLSAEVRLVWLVMARCEEIAEEGEKKGESHERRRKRGREGDLFSLSVCGPVRHLSHCFLMVCPLLHLSAKRLLLLSCVRGRCMRAFVWVFVRVSGQIVNLGWNDCGVLWHVHHVVFQCTASHKVSKMEGSLIVYQ